MTIVHAIYVKAFQNDYHRFIVYLLAQYLH